jgi:hypothetical protein
VLRDPHHEALLARGLSPTEVATLPEEARVLADRAGEGIAGLRDITDP